MRVIKDWFMGLVELMVVALKVLCIFSPFFIASWLGELMQVSEMSLVFAVPLAIFLFAFSFLFFIILGETLDNGSDHPDRGRNM